MYIYIVDSDAHIPSYIACAFVFAAAVVVVDVAVVDVFAPWGMLQRYPGTLILVSHDRSLCPDDPMHRKPGFLTQRGIQNSEETTLWIGDLMV